MKGHIRERGDGHWYAVIDIRDPAGERRRKWVSLPNCKGKRQAQLACSRLITEMQRGSYLEPTNTTIAGFIDHWLRHKQSQISPRALEAYQETARNIIPVIGNIKLPKLQPAIIAQMYATALKRISPASVLMMHRLLSAALKQAVKWQLLSSNPCDAVGTPRVERKQMHVLDADGAAALIEAARPRAMFMPVLLGVMCGLRRGWVAGLEGGGVDVGG